MIFSVSSLVFVSVLLALSNAYAVPGLVVRRKISLNAHLINKLQTISRKPEALVAVVDLHVKYEILIQGNLVAKNS